MAIEPFSVPYSQAAVDDLRERLARTRWPDEISGSGWEYGFDLRSLQEICQYWRKDFDWKAQMALTPASPPSPYLVAATASPSLHKRGRGPPPTPRALTQGGRVSF